MTDLNYIRNFSITDLPPILNVKIDNNEYLYITTPTTIAKKVDPLDVQKLTLVQNRIFAWESNMYFHVIDKFLSKAIHHLYTEEFIFAIIELQTSFESYIRMCHNLILVKDRKELDEIERAKTYSLKNTIVDHI